MQPKKLLFVAYGAGHIAMVLPVIAALRARHADIHIDLMALTTAGHEAKRQGFKTIGYSDFSHWYDGDKLKKYAAPLLNSTWHPLIDEAETIAYLGINFEELAQRLGEQAAADTYAEIGRWAFYPLEFMKKILCHLQTDVVVTTNSPRSEQAVIEAASTLGIPSLCMVDLFSPPGDPFLDRTLYADALTTVSALGKRNLAVTGIDPSRIYVTGSPAFDSIFLPQHREDAEIDRHHLGWDGLHVILWAGHLELLPPGMGQVSDPEEFPRYAERVLRDYVAQRKDVALVVRYHPNHASCFKPGADQERVLWSDASQRHAHRDIHLCDITVIQATTVGLEAAIAGKSVISLDHSPSRHVFPCSEQGISRGVSSFEALPAALDAAILKPFISELTRSVAGSSVQVAEVVEQLMARRFTTVTTRL